MSGLYANVSVGRVSQGDASLYEEDRTDGLFGPIRMLQMLAGTKPLTDGFIDADIFRRRHHRGRNG